jgi:aminoglycoside/choline kinase family phosphotransferase
MMHSSEMDDDFQRYVDIGRFLAGLKLQTPEIFNADTKEYCVLMEDLGNDTLYKIIESGVSGTEIERLYKKAVNSLVEFQTKAAHAWQDSGIEVRLFNLDYLRWETSYFQKNFLENYCGILNNEIEGLNAELDALAECVFNHPRIFMHRDFQSQNILVFNDDIRFVDFQGARIGPLAYDIMSLLNDPYVNISSDLKDRLIERYFKLLSERQISVDNPEFLSVTAGLQRNMQALGAYTFLALKKGKKDYLRFIPRGLECLLEGLGDFDRLSGVGFSLDNLSNICKSIDLELVRKRNNNQ